MPSSGRVHSRCTSPGSGIHLYSTHGACLPVHWTTGWASDAAGRWSSSWCSSWSRHRLASELHTDDPAPLLTLDDRRLVMTRIGEKRGKGKGKNRFFRISITMQVLWQNNIDFEMQKHDMCDLCWLELERPVKVTEIICVWKKVWIMRYLLLFEPTPGYQEFCKQDSAAFPLVDSPVGPFEKATRWVAHRSTSNPRHGSVTAYADVAPVSRDRDGQYS